MTTTATEYDTIRTNLNENGLEGDSLQETTIGGKAEFRFWYDGSRLKITLSGKVFKKAWGKSYVSRDYCRNWKCLG